MYFFLFVVLKLGWQDEYCQWSIILNIFYDQLSSENVDILPTFRGSTYYPLFALTGISDSLSPKLSTVWNVGLISDWSNDLIIIGNRVACLSYIKSNKNDNCHNDIWHLNWILKCHEKNWNVSDISIFFWDVM